MKTSLFRQRLALIIAGISLEILYVLYFLRLFPLVSNYMNLSALGKMTDHTPAAFWSFLFVFTMLFLLFVFSWHLVRKATDKYTLWIIGGFGLLFGVTMTFVYPITATDVYNYVAQSRVWTFYHQNPIFTPANTFLPDPIMMLTGGWGKFGSPYGPLGIMTMAIPSYLVPSNLLANLLLLKLFFSLFTLATAYLVYKIVQMQSPHSATSAALFVAWNPLIIFEVSANGHNDIFMMFLAVLAIYVLLKGHLKIGTVIVVLSALVKFATIILLPIFVVYSLVKLTSMSKRASYLFSAMVGSILVSVAAYYPFWQGIDTVQRALFENTIYLDSFSSFWGVLTHQYQYREGAMIGRTLFITCYCFFLYIVYKNRENFLRACFWSFFFFLLFCVTNFKIWYVIWPIVLAATTPKLLERGTATLFAYLATLSAAIFSYIWIWMGENTPKNFFFINSVSYLFTFVPPLMFFVGSMIYGKVKKKRVK